MVHCTDSMFIVASVNTQLHTIVSQLSQFSGGPMGRETSSVETASVA